MWSILYILYDRLEYKKWGIRSVILQIPGTYIPICYKYTFSAIEVDVLKNVIEMIQQTIVENEKCIL